MKKKPETHFVVFLKGVPDTKNLPPNAMVDGILNRGAMDTIINPDDMQALYASQRMRKNLFNGNGKIVVVSMGLPNVQQIVHIPALNLGADYAFLATDRKFAAADVPATAYALSMAAQEAIKRLGLQGNIVYCFGKEAIDGDTAQTGPEAAVMLDVVFIPYVVDYYKEGDSLCFKSATEYGIETIKPLKYPVAITVCEHTQEQYPTVERKDYVADNLERMLFTLNASDITGLDSARIGKKGSHTNVYKTFTMGVEKTNCKFVSIAPELAGLIKQVHEGEISFAKIKEEQKPYQLHPDKQPSYSGNIWVLTEVDINNQLHPSSLQLIGKAQSLAWQTGVQVGAILPGTNINLVNELINYGADYVYYLEHPLLAKHPSLYPVAITQLVKHYRPISAILSSATPKLRSWAPQIAALLKNGLTADCTDLRVIDLKGQNAIILQERPAFGGNLVANICTVQSNEQMATVRPGTFEALVPDKNRTGEVVKFVPKLTPGDIKLKFITFNSYDKSGPDLTTARIIVSGGAGLGSKDNFIKYTSGIIGALKKYLGEQNVVLGSSKQAVKMGFKADPWVGFSGVTVNPPVYIALGISGAIQHLQGMQKSAAIIVVNPDKHAPIFNYAHIGYVGKVEDIVPALIEIMQK